jgi:uncharacterized protein (TIGR03435 family)
MKTALLALVSCVAYAQTFDVADVHVSKPGQMRQGGMIPGSGRLEFRGLSLAELIQFAYGIDDDMISGGPKWLGYTQFDVFAKGKRGSSDETVKLMLRALLADRFKLVFHTVDKPLPAFVMTVGRRVLMKEAPEGEDTNCQPKGAPTENGLQTLECTNLSMAAFAERFHQYANGYLTHPVVDQTGLKGGYDFTIRWTGRGVLDRTHEGISFFEAADKQLGLKIEEKKVPLPAMAIDSVNETPTPNAPGVKENLPVEATEFEVAVVKKSAPGMPQRADIKNGRIDVQGMSIKDLLPFIWDVDPNLIVGVPKWLESDRYNIVAKAPTEVSMDALKVMLRNLFMEQFKLETHKEEQQVSVWVMTVSKKGLKMEKSSGAESSGCKPGGVANEMIHFTCKGTTLAQFGEQFHRYAGGYLDHSVVDETGLTDRYNFEISWTPRGRMPGGERGGTPPPAAGGTGAAADPSGLTFFEAAEKQLGVKFESQKRPMQVIVIDKASPLVADQ